MAHFQARHVDCGRIKLTWILPWNVQRTLDLDDAGLFKNRTGVGGTGVQYLVHFNLQTLMVRIYIICFVAPRTLKNYNIYIYIHIFLPYPVVGLRIPPGKPV